MLGGSHSSAFSGAIDNHLVQCVANRGSWRVSDRSNAGLIVRSNVDRIRSEVAIRFSGSECCTLWLGVAHIFALDEMFRDAFCNAYTQGDHHTHAIKRRQANEADC